MKHAYVALHQGDDFNEMYPEIAHASRYRTAAELVDKMTNDHLLATYQALISLEDQSGDFNGVGYDTWSTLVYEEVDRRMQRGLMEVSCG